MLRLIEPTAGEVLFRGENVLTFGRERMRKARRDMQMVFQDPFSSLNPRMRVETIVEEPLVIHRMGSRPERRARVDELLARVGLDPALKTRYPHEFSGGQRQRIGLARALALNPSFIIADEPVSALDVSIQAQVINLLLDLQRDLGLTYLFIAHDLHLVQHVCSRVAVMYLGRIVEMATVAQIFAAPKHPYTQALLSAVPEPDPDVAVKRIELDPASFDRIRSAPRNPARALRRDLILQSSSQQPIATVAIIRAAPCPARTTEPRNTAISQHFLTSACSLLLM